MDAREDSDAQPLPDGLVCATCRYDLTGLPRGGVCPECGTKTLESSPVWALAACDDGYVDHVRDEFVMLNWAAQACWAVLASILVASISAKFGSGGGAAIVGIGVTFVAVLAVVLLPLLVFYAMHAVDKHPNSRVAPGSTSRRRLRSALVVAEIGLGLALFWLFVAFFIGGDVGPAFVLATVVLVGGGLGWASIEAMAYGRLTLERAGIAGVGSGLLTGWGFALAVLSVVAVGRVFMGIDAPTALAAISGALLGPATVLSMRCARVAAVVGRVAERTDS